MNLSKLAARLRLPLGFVVGGLYLAFARPSQQTLLIGAVVAFLGILVRAWAAGHIIKNDKLATTGPYAHTRNPLYFGSFLIACGFAIAAHWALLVFVAVFWVLIYGPTIARERAKILEKFPDSYPDFERNVPAFFPRLTPWKGTSRGREPPSAPRSTCGMANGRRSSAILQA
ncbi:MAG: isoprenylcysteine carboxylmethyltransferase family protein [Gemmatimonadaceae bacterium]